MNDMIKFAKAMDNKYGNEESSIVKTANMSDAILDFMHDFSAAMKMYDMDTTGSEEFHKLNQNMRRACRAMLNYLNTPPSSV